MGFMQLHMTTAMSEGVEVRVPRNVQFTFENKWMISIAISEFAYCTPRKDWVADSDGWSAVEVAVFDEDGDFITKQIFLEIFPDQEPLHDDVAACVSTDDLAEIMCEVARQ